MRPRGVSVGQYRGTDSAEVGYRSAAHALSGLPDGEEAEWALAFCGGRLDENEVISGLRRVLGDVPIVGGAAVGVITGEGASYSGFECAVAVFPKSLPPPVILVESGLCDGEEAAGLRLGTRIRDIPDGGAVLLLYDSVHSAPPPRLHVACSLLEGLYRGLGDRRVHLVGGGTVADFNLTRGYVFDGLAPVRHAAVAVVLPDAYALRTTILHGCVPSSSFMVITRIEGAVVHELDHSPALDVLERLLGYSIDAATTAGLFLEVTLGQKHGDVFAPYDESTYVNRLIVNADPEARTLTLFEPDFEVGSRVQFMARDNELMLASVRRRTDALMADVKDENCLFGFYIDCAGRTSAFSGSEAEEAEVLLEHCRKDLPILGFYSGVEIAPLLGRSRPLDWTGVFTVFCAAGR